jgi:hypothetical protein
MTPRLPPDHPSSENSSTLVPRDELRLLVVTFADATKHAENGAVAWGLRAIEAGLTRARRAENAGEPWASQLLKQ